MYQISYHNVHFFLYIYYQRFLTGILINAGYFCPALAKAVKTMKKGEKVLLTVKPQCELYSHFPMFLLYASPYRSYWLLLVN